MLLSIVFIDLQWCRMDIITSETQANHSQHHLVKDGAHAEKILSFLSTLSTLGASWGGWMLSLVLAARTPGLCPRRGTPSLVTLSLM